MDNKIEHLPRSTFYDVIQTAWKDSSFEDQLTVKQAQYIQTYMYLSQAPDGEWSHENIPSRAKVANEIGVSRAAAATMTKRILKIAFTGLTRLQISPISQLFRPGKLCRYVGICILKAFSAGAAAFRWRKLLGFFINHWFCGISDNNSIRRDVFRHNGSCTYYTSIANRYTRRNDHTSTDPTVIPD